jgi:hypothetical protein
MNRIVHPTLADGGSSLVEVIFALGLVAFSFGALFSIFSSSFPLLRNQQETIAINLCLQERLDHLRSISWPVLTNGSRLRSELASTGVRSSANLSNFAEEITISAYPPASSAPTPLQVRRRSNGTVESVTEPTGSTLTARSLVRVDLRDTWRSGSGTRTRETSAIIALGGITK